MFHFVTWKKYIFNSQKKEDWEGEVGVKIEKEIQVSTLMTVTISGLIPPMDATFRDLIVQMNISLKVV